MIRALHSLAFALALVAIAPSASARTAESACSDEQRKLVYTQTGLASWYAPTSLSARTASGEPTSRHAFTAAHQSLPLGSVVRVINLENCRAITVTINDRGPHGRSHHRILDLSKPAARALGVRGKGIVRVRLEKYAE